MKMLISLRVVINGVERENVSFNYERYIGFKACYLKANNEKRDTFFHDGNWYETRYARQLINYLDPLVK